MASTIYRVKEPAKLADPPAIYSFSLLSSLSRCPRRWQLTYSTYPDVSGPYPSPYAKKSVQGQVVHEMLRMLVACLVEHGSPPIGSKEFAKAIQGFEFQAKTRKLMDDQLQRVRRNPRAWRVKELGFVELDIRNQVFQLLRSTWKGRLGTALTQTEVRNLAEVRVAHPTLPLAGYIDLVEMRSDGDVITDYKSGELADGYRDQVMLYGVLWWRERGRLPRLLRVISVSGDRIEVEPTEGELLQRELALKQEISQWQSVLQSRAPAQVDAHYCGLCNVRALCDDFWRGVDTSECASDIEVRIEKPRSYASVTASRAGEMVDITAEPSSDIDLASLPVGSRVRILSALPRSDGSLGLTYYSELYRLD